MKILRRVKVTVQEPFSGGQVTIKADGIPVMPIYLTPLKEPDYSEVPKRLRIYVQRRRGKEKYFWLSAEFLIIFNSEVSWEIEGEPKENVKVELFCDETQETSEPETTRECPSCHRTFPSQEFISKICKYCEEVSPKPRKPRKKQEPKE